MKKQTTPPKKQPAKKAAPPKKSPGGKVSRSKVKESAGNKAIPADATLVTQDADFAESVLGEMKKRFTAELIVDALEGIIAEGSYINKHGEDRPDAKTRLAALEKVLIYLIGKPIDRRETTTHTTYSYEELEQMVAHSSELRRALREMLAPFDAEDGVGGEKGRGGDPEKRRRE